MRQAMGYYTGFILSLGPKPEILYFAPPGIAKKKQFRPPLRGGNIGNLEAEPARNYLD